MLPVNGPRHGQNCEDHELYQQDYQEEHDVIVVGLLYRTELIFAYLRIEAHLSLLAGINAYAEKILCVLDLCSRENEVVSSQRARLKIPTCFAIGCLTAIL